MNVLLRCKEESDTNECLFSEYGYNRFTVWGWGLSLYVLVTDVLCGEPFITRLCYMHEIPLRPVTTVALFQSEASPCGVYGGQNGIGTCLFRLRRFPPVIINTHHSTHTSDDVYELSI